MPIKDKQKAKEYARISMLIKHARNKGENVDQLLTQRKFLMVDSAKNSRDSGQPRIILGTSDFKKLRLNNAIIVDKSLLIKAVLEAPSEVSLITRPRRWGKSLNLDMLKTFFEIETDDQGQPLSIAKRNNQKLFVGLKISNDQYAMIQQGQYPVIFLNLKETRGNSYKEIENNIKEKVITLFSENRYLKKYLIKSNELLVESQRRKLTKYLSGEFSKADLQDSLRFLSEILAKHFKRNVYILIDEYDEVINDSYVKFNQKPKEFEQILDLIRGILSSALKQNQYLEKGVLTGILRIAKASLFSGLNNVVEYTLLDPEFDQFYGFTQEEVNDLLTKVSNIVNLNDIKEWYNGYNFGQQIIYNPWSIMCCLSKGGALDTYWIDSGNTDLIDQAMLSDNNQVEMQTLLQGKSITKRIYKQIAFDQIKEKKDLFYSLLLFAGYLNPQLVNNDLEDPQYELTIPNREIRSIYKDRVIQWVACKLSIDIDQYYFLFKLLLKKKVSEFVEQLKEFLLESTSFFLVWKKQGELFYNGFMLGLTSILKPIYLINSESESGKGRADLILIPKTDRYNHAFIIEYKICDKDESENLKLVAEIGLKQIKEKKYNVKVWSHPQVKEIFNLSLAFCGKEVTAKCEVEEKLSEQSWQTRTLI